MLTPPLIAADCGILLLLIALAHAVLVLGAAWRWHATPRTPSACGKTPPISILKPLCGAEAGLYENLRSFCTQDYPAYEVIFGAQRAGDPALDVVRRLALEYPELTLTSVIDERSRGSNRKVSNLQNMVEHARHDLWVFADSDARVEPDYLSTVTAPLHDPGVGLVTCRYQDVPSANLWSRLAALYVNDWFMPSVLLAWALGRRDYVSGQTICVRRDTITAIGGLSTLSDHLADDYRFGELVRRSGRSIVLSHYVPQADHHEASLASLIRHEIRWMRTIAVLKPASFRMLFLSFSLPLALCGLILAASAPSTAIPALGLAAAVALLRVCIHWSAPRGARQSLVKDLWLIPLRDLLTVYVWARALRASRLVWRGVEFRVGDDGIMREIAEPSPLTPAATYEAGSTVR